MISPEDVARLVDGEHWDPFSVLGPHVAELEGRKAISIRAYIPDAAAITVVPDQGGIPSRPMALLHPSGLFEAIFPDCGDFFPYSLQWTSRTGHGGLERDPYAFPPLVTEYDLHLFAEGRHYRTYDLLGAHKRVIDGVEGVQFAVWAPNAVRVSVVGDFNQWDGRRHPMRSRGGTGLWEVFLPGLSDGRLYKYEIKSKAQGTILLKADPYASWAEIRPNTASVVWSLDRHVWRDEAWMSTRSQMEVLGKPIAIYEVHLGSWRRVPEEGNRWMSYQELAANLIPYVKDQGFTHIELMPVTEHPFDGSWGYQTLGYFAPTSRYGTPEDFMAFIDACHQADIGVILDWTPAHFPDDSHGLAWFDGTFLYDHEDPRLGYHPEWHSRIFNLGRTEVRNFLVNSALFWLDRYHIDGLRVDAVASMLYLDYARQPGEWIPNKFGGKENLEAVDFFKELNIVLHREHQGILTIAEESTAWPGVSRPTYVGGLGFSLKWNLGWMHDTLDYFSSDPIYRKYKQNSLTFSLLYAFSENFVLVLSHDEVVYGKRSLLDKMWGDTWQRFANLRALYGYLYAHPGKKMLFMGAEFGQWNEWNHDVSLDWHVAETPFHRSLRAYVTDLNRLYRSHSALYEVDFDWRGFQWIDCNDAENSILSFLRFSKNRNTFMVFVYNFTPVPRDHYRVGVPALGHYSEVLNSDASAYGGGNIGNGGGVEAELIPSHGFPFSITLNLPPLATLWLTLP